MLRKVPKMWGVQESSLIWSWMLHSFLLKQLQELWVTPTSCCTQPMTIDRWYTQIFTLANTVNAHIHNHIWYACAPQFLASYCKSLNFHLRWHAQFLNPCTCETLKTCRINSKIHNSLFFLFLKKGRVHFLEGWHKVKSLQRLQSGNRTVKTCCSFESVLTKTSATPGFLQLILVHRNLSLPLKHLSSREKEQIFIHNSELCENKSTSS